MMKRPAYCHHRARLGLRRGWLGTTASLLLTLAIVGAANGEFVIRQIGAWGGSVDAIFVDPDTNLAYVGSGVRMVILDVSDPGNILEVGSVIVGGVPFDILVRDNYAFIAASAPAFFSVVKVSDPTAPVLVASGVGPGGQYASMLFDGDTVHVTNTTRTDQGFDISDPENPLYLGECGGSVAEAIRGDSLYWAGPNGYVGDQYLRTDPPPCEGGPREYPGFIHIPELDGAFKSTIWIALSGEYAYVTGTWLTDRVSRLFVVDFSDLEAPLHVGTWGEESSDERYWIHGVSIADGRLYVVYWKPFGGDDSEYPALVVLDISADPTSPTPLGEFRMEGSVTGVTVVGTTAYLQDEREGLIIVDCSDPANPARVGNYFSPAVFHQGALDGDTLYVTDRRVGVTSIDVSDARSPTQVGMYPTGPESWGIAVRTDLAYVSAGPAGLQVLDVSDPADLLLAGAFPFDGAAAFGIALGAGDIVHVGTIPGAFIVNFDVSDLQDIRDVGFANIGGANAQPFTIEVTGDGIAHVARRTVLATASVADPENPFFISETTFNPFGVDVVWDVALQGNLLYVADEMGGEDAPGMYIVDVSDPYDLVQVGYYGEGSGADQFVQAFSVAVQAARAYLGARLQHEGMGLQVLDTSDPTSPVLLATHPTAMRVQDVVVDGATVYAITSHDDDIGAGVLSFLAYSPGDGDDDGDIDLTDLAGFESCVSGPGNPPGDVNCLIYDSDQDDDVDFTDFGALQLAFTGPR